MWIFNVVKVIVSTREECGQTDDIPALYLDSQSHNSDFDQSPQFQLFLPVLILVTSHFYWHSVLDFLFIYKVDSYTHLIIKLFM